MGVAELSPKNLPLLTLGLQGRCRQVGGLGALQAVTHERNGQVSAQFCSYSSEVSPQSGKHNSQSLPAYGIIYLRPS